MLWRQLGASTTHVNSEVVISCDVIFLAVKPHIFPKMMAELEVMRMEEVDQARRGSNDGTETVISPNTRLLSVDSKLFISVMAGVTIKTLSQSLNNLTLSPRIVRTHPNTPAMVGCGSAVFSLGEGERSKLDHAILIVPFSFRGD